MLRFRNLGSGSAGNATVVEGSDGLRTRRLLVDCGFGIRQIAQRLHRVGLEIAQIDAVFITHEHSDHVGCVHTLALRHRVPVWMSEGTWLALGAPDFDGLLHLASDLAPIDLGSFEALPFTVPHDAHEPLHLRCSDGTHHLGLVTDLGHGSAHVLQQLAGCHALMIEANHDPALLAASAYPAFLKRRVGGQHGHLANLETAGMLTALIHEGLECVVAAHLSARNNRPDLVRTALAPALGWTAERIAIATQGEGMPHWHTIGAP